jgi:hypothetical protein
MNLPTTHSGKIQFINSLLENDVISVQEAIDLMDLTDEEIANKKRLLETGLGKELF